MITNLLVVLAALCGIAYVLSPLRAGPRRDIPTSSIAFEEANERRRAAFTALLDIEEERDIGKLSAEDFKSLQGEYEVEALHAIDALERIGDSPENDQELEAEIADLKNKMTCPNCGALRKPGETCNACGAPA